MLCNKTLRNKVIAFLIFGTIIGTLFLIWKNGEKIEETIQRKFTSIQSHGYLAEGENEGESEESEEAKVYSINMLVNELNKAEGVSVSETKIKVEVPEGLTFGVYNVQTDEEILPDEEEKYEVPEDGVKFKIDGIEEKVYDISLEQAETAEEYVSTFQSATIEIDAQNGELKAFVKEIVKNIKGQEVVAVGSEENTAIFAYEDDENHNIKITGNEDTVIYYYIGSAKEELSEEDLSEVEWQTYDKENGLEVEKNCIVYSKSKYKTEEYSEISKIYVTNIDKIAPKIEVETKTEIEDDETSVQVTIEDEETDEYGASGIVAYAVTAKNEDTAEGENGTENESEVEEPKYIECEQTTKLEKEIDGITKNGTYYLWAKDAVGNVSKKEFEVTNIKVNVVAIILSSPDEALNGTEYESLNSLVSALKEGNAKSSGNSENTESTDDSGSTSSSESSQDENALISVNSLQKASSKAKARSQGTEESQKVVVQIVREIKNESVVLDDENTEIVLDLNGYTITSKEESEATITVASGKLQVVDNKYKISDYIEDEEKATSLEEKYSANTDQNGKIYNSNYIAIEVEEGAVLTLGEDDKTVSIVAPVIEGKEKGILNKGELNYYDGLVLGKSTIDGDINLTPAIYDPTASQTENDGVFQSYLAKVSGVEAVIGRTRYTKIETAIAVANKTSGTEGEQVEIDVMTNIIIDPARGTTDENGEIIAAGSLLIDESKNIKLDLNGNSITNTTSDYVIKNSGKLEIIDSNIEEGMDEATVLGKLFSTTSSVVYNEGELKLTSGAIETTATGTSSKYFYGINNIGKLSIEGGNISTTKDYTGAIYNNSEETLEIKGGIVSGYCYGIYHNTAGTVEVTGGTIKNLCSSSNFAGIYNNSTGTIEIIDGKLKCNRYGIYNYSTGTIKMSGGTIASDISTIINKNTGKVEVTGGTITSNRSDGIYNAGAGTITIGKRDGEVSTEKPKISGGECGVENSIGTIEIINSEIINSPNGISNYSTGTIEIINTEITNSSTGIYNKGEGTIEVTGGIITASTYGIYNYGTGIIEVTETNVTTTGSYAYSYGIYNYSTGAIEIIETNVTTTGSSAYGIYNYGKGTIIIGKKDGEIEENINIIANNSYGLYNNSTGKIYYYDGIIKGKTDAISRRNI